MKTANGINIAEKKKSPMRQALEYFESTVREMEESLDNGDTTFTEEESISTVLHLNFIKCLLEEEKDIINEAYEDGFLDGGCEDHSGNYFELNFES